MVLYAGIILVSCAKTSFTSGPIGSVQVVNALMASASLKLNSNETDSVLSYNARVFGLAVPEAKGTVRVYSSFNPGKTLWSTQLDMQEGNTYSLFIYGAHDNPQTLWQREIIPARYNDSVVGIRIAHLATGIGIVELKLVAGSGTILVPSVEYGTVSSIVKVPLPRLVPAGGDMFEVWEKNSGSLLATYTIPADEDPLYPDISVSLQRFKNFTLVLRGSKDSTGFHAPALFPVVLSY